MSIQIGKNSTHKAVIAGLFAFVALCAFVLRVPLARAGDDKGSKTTTAAQYTCDSNGICYCTGGANSAGCKNLGGSKDCGEKTGCDDKKRCYCTGGPGAPQGSKASRGSTKGSSGWSRRIPEPPKP